MYGSHSYGSVAYGSIGQGSPILVVKPSVLGITATLITPVIFTEEAMGALSITASLLSPTVVLQSHEIVVKINTVDVSNQINFETLSVNNNLYSDPDNAFFEIIKSPGKSYTPAAGDKIEILDTGKKIFGGILIKMTKELVGFSELYSLEFKDWTEELGNILVDDTYENTAVEDIIADIFTNTDLADYDGETNVSDTTVIDRIVFDNVSVIEALDKLAEISGKNWYVSPSQEIYFFADGDVLSPYNLTDTNGKYLYSSLKIDEDLTQIRNRVTVKGTGIAAVTVEDETSQSENGLREYFERFNDINATNEATQKADSILAAYKDPIDVVNFKTRIEGLYAGQQINIQSDIRGIDKTLTIQSVEFRAEYNNRFSYNVKATSQRLSDLRDLLQANLIEGDNTPSVEDQGSLQDIAFTAIDDTHIQWTAGTIWTSNGNAYSIAARASQVLTADHIIYLDTSISETELQISTNFTDGIGSGKVPIAYASASAVSTKGAAIYPIGMGGKMQLDGSVHITDRSIFVDQIAANQITANEIAAVGIIGRTIKAVGGSSGVDVWMDSTDGNLKFYYGGSAIGKILTDNSNLIYQAPIHFFGSNSAQYLQITSDGLLLPSSKSVRFTGGGRIKDNGAYLKIEGADGGVCDLQVEGNVYPNADNARQCGTSDKRWQDVNSEDAHIDDIFIGDRIYSSDGSQGITESKKFVVDIRSQTTQGRLEKKDAEIVAKDGLITDFGGDSDWTDCGPMNP